MKAKAMKNEPSIDARARPATIEDWEAMPAMQKIAITHYLRVGRSPSEIESAIMLQLDCIRPPMLEIDKKEIAAKYYLAALYAAENIINKK